MQTQERMPPAYVCVAGRRYVPEAAASASAPGLGLGFSNLDELIKRVEIALGEALPAKDDKSTQDKVPIFCMP